MAAAVRLSRGGQSWRGTSAVPLLLLVLLLLAEGRPRGAVAFQAAADPACADELPDCADRVGEEQAECREGEALGAQCKRTCGLCGGGGGGVGGGGSPKAPGGALCADDGEGCEDLAAAGECLEVGERCKRTCGLCGEMEEPSSPSGRKQRKELPHDMVPDGACHDAHPSCEVWAANGQCRRDLDFMARTCPESCYLCLKARPAVLRRVAKIAEIFSWQSMLELGLGDGKDRLIKGVDPVYDPARLDPVDFEVEYSERVNKHSAQVNRMRGESVASVQEEVGELVAAPGLMEHCGDWNSMCPHWARSGECIEYPWEMGVVCGRSCNLCIDDPWSVWEAPEVEAAVVGWFSGPLSDTPPLPPRLHLPDADWFAPRARRHGKAARKKAATPREDPAPAVIAAEEAPELGLLDRCADSNADRCKVKAVRKFCTSHVTDMSKGCRMSCGLCQRSRVEAPPRVMQLHGGKASIPSIGLSIQGMGEKTKKLVGAALAAGVRRFHAEPADRWQSRMDLLADAIHHAGVDREEVYVVLELLPTGFGRTVRTVLEAMQRARLDYVDMVLLSEKAEESDNATSPLMYPSWSALESMWSKKVVRHLGSLDGELSFNLFLNKHSAAPVLAAARCMDPFFPDRSVADQLFLRGTLYMAHDILGGHWSRIGLLHHPPLRNATAVLALARRLKHSVPDVAARWALQRGAAVTWSMAELEEGDVGGLMRPLRLALSGRQMAVLDRLEGQPMGRGLPAADKLAELASAVRKSKANKGGARRRQLL
eukprot:jgi/Tetstr1/447792/TSEL_035122.t1